MRSWPLWFSVCLLLTSCSTIRRASPPHPPSASVSTPAASLNQTGAAQVPARATVRTSSASLPLPSGTAVQVEPSRGTVTYTLSRDTSAAVETKVERLEAPQAFTPPPPPSPAEEAAAAATATGIRAFWLAALACLIGAGVAFWSGHVLAAVLAAAAGIALPVLAQTLTRPIAATVGALLLGAAAALVAAWYILRSKIRHGPS